MSGNDASNAAPLRPIRQAQGTIYAVAGGNHVTIELDRSATDASMDAIEVLAQPGGGPPPHRHAFGEWFRVRAGELTLSEERNGTVVCTRVISAGESVWVPPWVIHGTLNLSDVPVRFAVIGVPGSMSGYFAEAGIEVPDELTVPSTEPPGPAQLAEISARWGIEFWGGPVDRTPPT